MSLVVIHMEQLRHPTLSTDSFRCLQLKLGCFQSTVHLELSHFMCFINIHDLLT